MGQNPIKILDDAKRMMILIRTRPDTRHKMRLVCVLFTFENNTGRTYGPTGGRTDTTSYRDATAHLKTAKKGSHGKLTRWKKKRKTEKKIKKE